MAATLRNLVLFACVVTLCGGWANAKRLLVQAPHGDRNDNLKFGQSTCISNDGLRIIVGANGYDKYSGAVYVYDMVTAPGDRLSHWRRTKVRANDTERAEEKSLHELRVVARGSGFGFSCALSGDGSRVVVGAPGHGTQRGAVYVFECCSSAFRGKGWEQIGQLQVDDGRPGDAFGWDVVVNDECTVLATSAKGKRANNGVLFVYECEKGCKRCVLSETIAPPDHTDSVGDRGIRIRNNFGTSLGMNRKGDILVASSIGYNEERGAVYVFHRDGEGGREWKLLQRLESPKAQRLGFFGYGVAVDESGDTVAVGADGENEYTGAVYVFRREGVGKKYEFVYEVNAEEAKEEDNFGGAVALSADGKVLAVGAPGVNEGREKDLGVVHLYEEVLGVRGSRWELGETVSIAGERGGRESFFGWNVAISANGKRFVGGAPQWLHGAGAVAFGAFEASGRRAPDAGSLMHDEPAPMAEGRDEL
ncbi:hypothetical protein BWQ96_06590 [Gracilariopsis chorda]|uniref:Uncharacterized protein n=1 Tax=Gracilariopsis chorda TaxID=448386 RepID=A0A2V3INM4_9FLOR|nr:hypothetical protein BWQ96_06590 [Gracilariopsis chorda]|eukprot:PXF43685.1 hypothetical protein BWQ96_06590 [Gracilariopsis chorda]